MNLYEKASLIITPNAYKAGKIYAAKPTSGLGDLTFSRPSAQTRRNSAGALENLANHIPALDYPTVGGCPWWNFPVARTNLFFNSQAPVTQNITVVSGSTYTVSVGAGGSATLSNAGTGSATSTTPFTFVASSTTLTVTIVSAPIWCQVELGSYASPLIVTGGAAATRVLANPNTNGLTSFIGQTEGSWYTEIRTDNIVNTAAGDVVSINSNTSASVYIGTTASSIRCYIYHSTGFILLANFAMAANTTYKIAFRYKSGDSVVYINGTPFTSAVNFTFSTSLSNLEYPSNSILGPRPIQLFGTNIFFKTPLTNAELLALTT